MIVVILDLVKVEAKVVVKLLVLQVLAVISMLLEKVNAKDTLPSPRVDQSNVER